MSSEGFAAGRTTTNFLADFAFAPHAAEVLAPGMNTTVQVCIASRVLLSKMVFCTTEWHAGIASTVNRPDRVADL